MKTKKFALLAACLSLSACSSLVVHQQDLDAWVGAPVEALDTHAFFITVPMSRTLGPNGVEIRNYVHGADVSSCFSNAGAIRSGNFVNSSAFTSCSSGQVVCNNVFYIKDGKVLEYAPAGRCYTTSSLQPEAQYMRVRTQ